MEDSNPSEESVCCICLEPLTTEVYVLTGCSHQYHKSCISQWLQQHVTCPICRVPVQLGTEDDMVSPERLSEIEDTIRLGKEFMCTFSAILELLFPSTEGFTALLWDTLEQHPDILRNILNSDRTLFHMGLFFVLSMSAYALTKPS